MHELDVEMATTEPLKELTLLMPDDWHVHLRDGRALQAVASATALQFRRAIVMPNLKPPVVTVDAALAYRTRILDSVAWALQTGFVHGVDGPLTESQRERLAVFDPRMVLYLTPDMKPAEIDAAINSGVVQAVKYYPAGATTNSDAGARDLLKQCGAVLERMQAVGLPLLVHGEVTDHDVDVFDREAVFIEQVFEPLRKALPALRIVFEHITTQDAAQYVIEHAARNDQGQLLLAATITPQHLLYNRNAMLVGGVRPHMYCLPVLKREVHRKALLQAATSGLPQFFLGTDSAPHARTLKEASCGCAGCYSAPYAMALYAEAFELAGALQNTQLLEGFASRNGPAFYDLPVNTQTLTLQRKQVPVPTQLPFATECGIVPLRAGEAVQWRVL